MEMAETFADNAAGAPVATGQASFCAEARLAFDMMSMLRIAKLVR